MSAKAVSYEQVVRDAFLEAKKASAQYKSASEKRDTLVDQKRWALEAIEDVEMNIISDERSKHPEMSQAQMDKHLKVAINKNASLRKMREGVLQCSHSIDEAESLMKSADIDSKTMIARMTELGGYFNYLAAVKSSE